MTPKSLELFLVRRYGDPLPRGAVTLFARDLGYGPDPVSLATGRRAIRRWRSGESKVPRAVAAMISRIEAEGER